MHLPGAPVRGSAPAAPLPRRWGLRDRGGDLALLDNLGPDIIGFGPDTGHLRWAGIDPAAFIARYADRIGGIHIKDCFADHLTAADRGGELPRADRHEAALGRARSGGRRLRRGPAAMPADYDGDFMIEIDEPSVESRYESHRMSFEWAQKHLPIR